MYPIRCVYSVYALRRSGQHAVIHWLCAQHGAIRHSNDDRRCDRDAREVFNAPYHRVDYGIPRDLLINREHADIRNYQQYHLHSTERFYHIAVIRDFRNWLASVIMGEGVGYSIADAELWKYYARACLFRPSRQLNTIIFDRWFADPAYRRRIAAQLDVPFTDAGLNDVGTYGHGSSFDERDYDGRAQEMDVLNRWRAVQTHPDYRAITERYARLVERTARFFTGEWEPGDRRR